MHTRQSATQKPTPYAAKTVVPVERTRQEIEQLVKKHGGERFAYMSAETEVIVGFSLQGRLIKMVLPMPSQQEKDFEQEERRVWRALSKIVKAKFVAVADGISTIEQAFLADLVLPNGMTVEKWLKPQLKAAYDQGQMPKQLTFGPAK